MGGKHNRGARRRKRRGGGRVIVREAREGREGIWTTAKARSSAKHTVQECQQTPPPLPSASHPVLHQSRERERAGRMRREKASFLIGATV